MGRTNCRCAAKLMKLKSPLCFPGALPSSPSCHLPPSTSSLLAHRIQTTTIESHPLQKPLRSTALELCYSLHKLQTQIKSVSSSQPCLAHDRVLQSRRTSIISNDHTHHSIDNTSQSSPDESRKTCWSEALSLTTNDPLIWQCTTHTVVWVPPRAVEILD